jgi:hypothetical protein
MTVDVFLPRRRPWALGLATFILGVAALGGGALLAKYAWLDKPEPAATVLPASNPIDPIETGAIAAGDSIGDMIDKLDVKGASKPH